MFWHLLLSELRQCVCVSIYRILISLRLLYLILVEINLRPRTLITNCGLTLDAVFPFRHPRPLHLFCSVYVHAEYCFIPWNGGVRGYRIYDLLRKDGFSFLQDTLVGGLFGSRLQFIQNKIRISSSIHNRYIKHQVNHTSTHNKWLARICQSFITPTVLIWCLNKHASSPNWPITLFPLISKRTLIDIISTNIF